MTKIFFIGVLFLSINATAYPDFIGFNYRSCLICHYSGTGGGALTDYGRGVFASEIADNPLKKWVSNEEISSISNFLGPIETPWWVRLGYKQRKLIYEKNPGSSGSIKKFYSMQDQLNLNFFFKENQSLGLISTIGLSENLSNIFPHQYLDPNTKIFFQETFFRFQFGKPFWVYIGLMDKTFGIKHADHTSVNRSSLDLGNNSQTHGLLFQWAQKESDLFAHFWAGQLQQESSLQKKGGSLFYEQKIFQSHAIGGSILVESNADLKTQMLEIHNKLGFNDGHSFLLEAGIKNDKTELSDKSSAYSFSQGALKLRRGLFLISNGEYFKSDISTSSGDYLTWKFGFLWFPIQRFEFRFYGINNKALNTTDLEKDKWALQSQMHLSL